MWVRDLDELAPARLHDVEHGVGVLARQTGPAAVVHQLDSTLNPKSTTLNPEPQAGPAAVVRQLDSTLNPKSTTLNPKPQAGPAAVVGSRAKKGLFYTVSRRNCTTTTTTTTTTATTKELSYPVSRRNRKRAI